MSLTQALSTAMAGLRTTQTSLSIVAANVANAQTPGYVRKHVEQESIAGGSNGISVRVAAVTREIDLYVQRQLRTEAAGGAYANLKAEFYSRLQLSFGEPGASSSLESSFNALTSAADALVASPDDVSARAGLLRAAQTLAQKLGSMTSDIQSLRADAEAGLSDAAAQANAAMQQIAVLNRKLAGAPANDAVRAGLLDQRDLYVDRLSQIIDIRTSAGAGDQLNVFTGTGIQLVGTAAATLSFDARGAVAAESRWDSDPAKSSLGSLIVTAVDGSSVSLMGDRGVRSGTMAAYLEMRDRILPEAQAQLDTLAAGLAQATSQRRTAGTAVSSGGATGFDIDTAALLNGDRIDIDVIDPVRGPQRITLVRADPPAVLADSASATGRIVGVDLSQGVAAAAAALNAKLGSTINFGAAGGTTLRLLGGPSGASVSAAASLRTVTTLADGVEFPLFTDNAAPFSNAPSAAGRQVTGFAGRIAVNAALLADPSALVKLSATTPAGDATRPTLLRDRLAQAGVSYAPSDSAGGWHAPFSGALPTFLRQIISTQGDAAENASSPASGQEVVVNALTQRLSETSGVNVDAEMASLVNLQTAYGANARVLTAVRDMLEALMRI